MNKKTRTHKWDEGDRIGHWDDNGRWLEDYVVLPFILTEAELPSYNAIWKDIYDVWPAWYPCLAKTKCVFDK